MKTCNNCKAELPLSEFYKHPHTKDGVGVWCKPCTRTRERERRLEREYGLEPGQYEAMLDAQEHRCAACGTQEPGGKGVFVVDHCHATGRVRSLMCNGCNSAYGLLKEDIRRIEALAEYHRKHVVLS